MSDMLVIPFRDKMIRINFGEFEEEVDVDQLTSIDHTNLYAELITIPALMNRVGMWKAEAVNRHAEFKLDLKIYQAKRAEHYRMTLREEIDGKTKTPTKDKIADALLLDKGVAFRMRKELRLQKEVDFMDALYWGVHSKNSKLTKMTERMNFSPEEFEKQIVEGRYNGLLIQVRDKAIKG